MAIDIDKKYLLQFDGASRGNPGRGASACTLSLMSKDGPREIDRAFMYHRGIVTCNAAEYMGCIGALRLALDNGLDGGIIRVEGDSKLIIEHLFGNYKCRSRNLMNYYHEAMAIISKFKHVEGIWIPREKNGRADALCNIALNKSLCHKESMFAVNTFNLQKHLEHKFPGFGFGVEFA